MKERYLEILKNKENEAIYNHKESIKTEKQLRSIRIAAQRERMAFEEGMKNEGRR